MDYSKFIVSNQKEESISLQRVKHVNMDQDCASSRDFGTHHIMQSSYMRGHFMNVHVQPDIYM